MPFLEENRRWRNANHELRLELQDTVRRNQELRNELAEVRDRLEHAERKLAGEWPHNPRLALLERADLYEKDGQPGPLASWGWSDVARELRAVAELFKTGRALEEPVERGAHDSEATGRPGQNYQEPAA